MSALVTEGTGYIGSHLGEALIAEKYEVLAADGLATGMPAK
jgi:nucleoside-diphosphate-sugar epimerase